MNSILMTHYQHPQMCMGLVKVECAKSNEWLAETYNLVNVPHGGLGSNVEA
jgi:hypothetical protein